MDKGKCPEGTYSDDETKECKNCHFSCKTCKGPENHECIKCSENYIQKNLSSDNVKCIPCHEGEYTSFDNENECKNCLKSKNDQFTLFNQNCV